MRNPCLGDTQSPAHQMFLSSNVWHQGSLCSNASPGFHKAVRRRRPQAFNVGTACVHWSPVGPVGGGSI